MFCVVRIAEDVNNGVTECNIVDAIVMNDIDIFSYLPEITLIIHHMPSHSTRYITFPVVY